MIRTVAIGPADPLVPLAGPRVRYTVAGPGKRWLSARVGFDFQAAYDELNPADRDYRFYAALAASAGASSAVDLGCGTGTLALMLAAGGASVTGVDPDPEMLRVARSKDQEGRVDWRLGHSDVIDPGSAEFAVMSGHVAQVFAEDGAWLAALRDLHAALVPDGLLAFESRKPRCPGVGGMDQGADPPHRRNARRSRRVLARDGRRRPSAGQLRHAHPQPAHRRGRDEP